MKLFNLFSKKRPPLPDPEPEPEATTVAVMDWFKTQQSLYRKEITDYETAREARYNVINPLTYPLQQLYRDAMLDNVLSNAIKQRALRVTNKTLVLKDKAGNIDEPRSCFVQTKWFRTMARRAIESKFYGYSLVYISKFTSGNIIGLTDIDREHVIPERGVMLRNPMNPHEYIRYTDYPHLLIYIQLDDAVGQLEKIAPLTILKRHSWASWDDLEQIFGIPIRVAKTMIDTEKHKNELEEWLRNMGSASYGIFDKRVDIEIHENNQPDVYQIFNEKRKAVNEEITIAVNGQTMTTMDGSSLAQAKVHEKTQEEITNEDINDVEDWFNGNFIHVMRALGYDIPEGHYLDITTSTTFDIDTRSKTDDMLLRNGYRLDKDYIESTYDVVLDADEPIRQPAPDNPRLDFFL